MDTDQINQIIDESLNHSHVVADAEWLSDHIGSRLTNSPGIRVAEQWTMGRFRDIGLSDVRKQAFPFGRGWSFRNIQVRLVEPRLLQLHATPLQWTPGTNGPVTASVIFAPMEDEADMARWHGKLAGKFVLVDEPELHGPEAEPSRYKRYSSADLAKMDSYPAPLVPGERPTWLQMLAKQAVLDKFLKSEGALGMVRCSYTIGQLVHGYGYQQETGAALPGIDLGGEDYGRLVRLANSGGASLEINSRVRFDDSDRNAYNILADLPGTDPASGYVMTGAHLDSMAWADGAADDGAGVAAVIEAARIIKALNIHTKRTIRFALWSGEEQGLLGSKAYVQTMIARRPPPPPGVDTLTDFFAYPERMPITKLPGYNDIAAYFGIDQGSGKVRGVYAEGNITAMPILKQLIEPLASLGVTEVSPQRYDDSDHVFFTALGLPAFSLVQDPLDYERTATTATPIRSTTSMALTFDRPQLCWPRCSSRPPIAQNPCRACPSHTEGGGIPATLSQLLKKLLVLNGTASPRTTRLPRNTLVVLI